MENKNSNNKGLLIGVIVLLLGSIAFNIYQYSHGVDVMNQMQAKIDTVYIEKGRVQEELEITSADLEKYKGMNDSLDRMVNEQQMQLQELEQKINNLKSAAKKDAAKKKELDALVSEYKQKLNDALEQIDKLITENKMLKDENANLNTQVSSLTDEKSNLQQKVNTAALIKTEYVKIKSLKDKMLGDGYAETSLAKKVSKFDISFTMLDNKLASTGDKTIHIRLIGPDGKVISQNTQNFKRNDTGEEVQFTSTLFVNYDNGAKKEVAASYEDKKANFKAGKYKVEVYIDGIISGAGGVVLK
jgi:uncharacterized coiled-coil DUF342 family protein